MTSLFTAFQVPDDSQLYAGHYDAWMVVCSVALAVFASFAAIQVADRLSHSLGAAHRRAWIAGGALSMGAGIWGMHFIGMLAFSLPCATRYDTGLTLLSTLPGVAASALAIQVIGRSRLSRRRLAVGGLLFGVGIGAMHFMGMGAMRFDGSLRYHLGVTLLALALAVVLATLALWISFRAKLGQGRGSMRRTLGGACVMGLAISAMHYTAMAGASFVRGEASVASGSELPAHFLAAIVLGGTSLMVLVTLLASQLSERLSMPRSYRLIAVLMIGWVTALWTALHYHFDYRAEELYQREFGQASQQANQIADDLLDRVQRLRGAAEIGATSEEAVRALQRVGPDVRPASAPPTALRERWTQEPTLRQLNQSLRRMGRSLGTDAVYLLNAAGDCIAASNADDAQSFVGVNFADREYFRQTRADAVGHQFAMGRRSQQPGMFYAAAVRDGGRYLGAMVVKLDLRHVPLGMKYSEAFLTDRNGVVVLATDKALEFQALAAGAAAWMSAQDRELLYGRSDMRTIGFLPWGGEATPAAVLLDGATVPVVLASRRMGDEGIQIYVPRTLADLSRLQGEKLLLLTFFSLAGCLLILSGSALMHYLRESRSMGSDLRIAATAFESQQGMLITDADSHILKVNRTFTEITGYTEQELLGRKPKVRASGRHEQAFFDAMWMSIDASGTWSGEIWNRRKSGEVYPEWMTITAVKGSDGAVSHYVATCVDITQRKEAEDRITHLAYYDHLTNLPNRKLMMDFLEKAIASAARRGTQGALLMIDLDNFKVLNDTLGHAVGDQLLQEVAQRLKSAVREVDTVARLGGDEFVLVLCDLAIGEEGVIQAETVARKVLAVLREPYQLAVKAEDKSLHSHSHQCSSSLGVTMFKDHALSPDELMRRADTAMYQAKASGRNTLSFFDPAMLALTEARAAIEVDLRRAIEVGQFQLHYQPRVAADGRVTGAEALVRWLHPERGMVSPAEFIPLAEQTGLIVALGRIVLTEACRQLALWTTDPVMGALRLSVNLTAREMRQPDFVEQVLDVVRSNGTPADRLELELTESMLFDDAASVIEKMRALKAHGISFSLDDFGTGYSCLSYLKRLPLDHLKIDQSFVREVLSDPNDAAIARTVLALGRTLGLSVVAEGVETHDQRDFLTDAGCDSFQGYLFSRPLPLEAFKTFVREAAASYADTRAEVLSEASGGG